ncbi:type II toxin-antitoxin system PemK/MazF family toxin [Candidatus Latescibacterota bacterium]
MNTKAQPRRGEVWLVELDPTRGAEMQKTRPAVVLSSDALGVLLLKLVAPITGWNPRFEKNPWHVLVEPDETNRLTKRGAIDVLQIRSLDVGRFQKKLGRLSADLMEEVALAVALVVEVP